VDFRFVSCFFAEAAMSVGIPFPKIALERGEQQVSFTL
jgi:hypothetical protein